MNPYIQYRCDVEAAAGTSKIANIEDTNVWFHSYGAVVEQDATALQIFSTLELFMLLPHCLNDGKLAWSAFPPFCLFLLLHWTLLSTAAKVSKMPATVMKDNYIKLNSSCMRLWLAPCSDLCFMVLCNQKCCFLLDLLLHFSSIGDV